jgi:hypothetical protein
VLVGIVTAALYGALVGHRHGDGRIPFGLSDTGQSEVRSPLRTPMALRGLSPA